MDLRQQKGSTNVGILVCFSMETCKPIGKKKKTNFKELCLVCAILGEKPVGVFSIPPTTALMDGGRPLESWPTRNSIRFQICSQGRTGHVSL